MYRFNVGFLLLISFVNVVLCRDFYAGVFKKNDFLVAQDTLFKERVPYQIQYAKYGKVFKCPYEVFRIVGVDYVAGSTLVRLLKEGYDSLQITYIRAVDRLGYGKGPKAEIIRGGLRKKYVVLRLSSYNMPISVNVYVGCENKNAGRAVTKPTTAATTASPDTATNGTNEAEGEVGGEEGGEVGGEVGGETGGESTNEGTPQEEGKGEEPAAGGETPAAEGEGGAEAAKPEAEEPA